MPTSGSSLRVTDTESNLEKVKWRRTSCCAAVKEAATSATTNYEVDLGNLMAYKPPYCLAASSSFREQGRWGNIPPPPCTEKKEMDDYIRYLRLSVKKILEVINHLLMVLHKNHMRTLENH